MASLPPHNPESCNWRCGLESEGHACSAGPKPRGVCPGAAECSPIRDGDRWLCNRSEQRGGPCDLETPGGGPSPDGLCCLERQCRPRRTLRAVRGDWVAGAIVLALGITMMLLGSAERNEWIAPGPLTSHHAAVVAQGAESCATCHPNADDAFSSLITQAAIGDSSHNITKGFRLTQSVLCLDCHRELSVLGAEPMLAHGISSEKLSEFASEDTIACAVCHQEHHGAGYDLKTLTDGRCQSCHQQSYKSFASDHPEFGLWPMRRRTRIHFNHASHQTSHYAKANESFDCKSCHLLDPTGDLTARVDYVSACATCHDDDINKSFERGVAFISLPMLDDVALADAGLSIEQWPSDALGDFDGDVSPILKLLLAAEPNANEAMARLGYEFSFFDIDPTDPNQTADAATIASALKRLLEEIQEEGHANFAYRLRTLLGAEVSDVTLAELMHGLPVELIDQILLVWFDDKPEPEEFDAMEDRRTGGGWFVDYKTLSLRYRPSGHDDPFLKAWLDVIAALPAAHAPLRDACLSEYSRLGAPGACLTCHSVDQTPGGKLAINWRGRYRLSEPRGFTHFTHRPHLKQPELMDCTHCHAIDSSADLEPSYASTNPNHAALQFVTLSKAACAGCHQPHAAGDSCTQCHNYHVSPENTSRLPTRFP